MGERTALLPMTVVWLAAALSSAHGAQVDARVEDENGAPVADAVVIAVPRFAYHMPAPRPDQVEQIGKEFVPRVKVVLVGTPVRFPNRDDVKHHVNSFSPAKKFEIELYKGTPPDPVVFAQPGEVTLGCNIHDWMTGQIYVSESPFFATTDATGQARLANLPPGSYELRVWHFASLTGEPLTRRTLALAEPSVQARWRLRMRQEARIRRAPAGGGSGYR